MRTLVVSDLHLGAGRRTDVLRRPEPLQELCAHLAGFDRLVVLGDAVELRHAPQRDALTAAAPVLAALGEALGPDGELVLVAGNHDHHLIAPWLQDRAADGPPPPLGLQAEVDGVSSGALGYLRDSVAPARLRVAHPGVWLREDVYAIHGHYLDRLITIPTFERLAAGAMARVVGPLPERHATAEDFEAALTPLYAWIHAVAQASGGSWSAGRQSASAGAWQMLTAAGPRVPLKARVLAALFPLAVRGLNRAGLGPVRAQLSGEELRRAGLTAMRGVVARLGVGAAHVIFGHTHRAGPLPGDDRSEWRVGPDGPQLHNAGCWIDEPVFARGGTDSPYWGGRAIELTDRPGEVPRLVRVTGDLGARPPRPA